MSRITLEQLQAARNDPNVRRYLDAISWAEGTTKNGYYTTFGGGRIDDLSRHPNKVWGRTGDGPTTATGRYQFIGSTFNNLQKKYGLKDFGEESQDLAAIALIAEKGALNDVMSGNIDTANRKLSKTWASLPYNNSPHQKQRTVQDFEKAWNGLGGKEYPTEPVQTASNSQTQQGTSFYQSLPTQITADTPNWVQAFTSSSSPSTNNPLTAFTNYFNQLNGTQDGLSELPTTINYQQKYQNELAKAFGVEPSTKGIMPNYIGDLVRSIYDQA